MSIVDDLHRARQAYERREWVAAYRALSDLDEAELKAADFVALATTAYLLGRRNDTVQALQRAYQAHLDEGDVPAAVRTAYWLTTTLWAGGEVAIGSGWLARAERLLDEYGEDVVERGYLLERATLAHIIKGEFAEAFATVPQVAEYGRRYHDPDLTAVGLHQQGRLMIYGGKVADGLRFLDEAMVAVLAGEVSPIFSGIIYCSSVEACQEIFDLGRAGEWTHALTTWCHSQPGLVAFTGQCAVHRGQLMRLHGAYRDAVNEFERAAVRYAEAGGSPAVGLAHYKSVARHSDSGEYDAADAAFDAASEFGHLPSLPGHCSGWPAAVPRPPSARSTAAGRTPGPGAPGPGTGCGRRRTAGQRATGMRRHRSPRSSPGSALSSAAPPSRRREVRRRAVALAASAPSVPSPMRDRPLRPGESSPRRTRSPGAGC